VVRGTLFTLGFFGFWRRLVPDETGTPGGSADRRQRLAYVLMACGLSVLVLGWFGRVRMLTAIGFAQIPPVIDTLFTGLLLVAGAERSDALLKRLGAGGEDSPSKNAARPVEITGRVVLEDSAKQVSRSP
jgi:hypothetical protein